MVGEGVWDDGVPGLEAAILPGLMPQPSESRAGILEYRCRGVAAVTGGAPYVDPGKLARARELRRAPTPSTALAWRLLRGRGVCGLKFRREQVIDGFLTDFYCPSLGLVVEIDGGVHEDPEQMVYDTIRSQCLTALGLQVIRVRNQDVSREHLERLLSSFTSEVRLPLSIHGEGVGG